MILLAFLTGQAMSNPGGNQRTAFHPQNSEQQTECKNVGKENPALKGQISDVCEGKGLG